MSEEIKEILDRIKYIVDNPTYEDVYYEGVNRCVDENPNYTALDSKESKLLLDYITNLQQKVEQLEKELNQEKEEYAGLHKVLNNKEEEFEKENYNNVVEISRLKRKVEQLENIRKEAIEECKSVIGNPEHTIVSKNELMKIMLDILNKGGISKYEKNWENKNRSESKMELRINYYVRTDDGLIGKIVSEPYEYKDSIGHDIDFGDNNIYNEYEMYQSIIKSSPNIIDLIEVGDYVNGEKVTDKFDYLLAFGNNDYYKNENEIKNIVTKEQFKEMEYKIGD